jgi:hypothetical protein
MANDLILGKGAAAGDLQDLPPLLFRHAIE